MSFTRRPGESDAWVRAGDAQTSTARTKADLYPARLTVDVTAELRARIKVAAFRGNQTVADLLRALLEERFPPEQERRS